jgi:hypothetical protein
MLMQSQSTNEYVAQQNSEQTDWVVTFPTKRFYVDPALNATGGSAPFDTMFVSHASLPLGSCVLATFEIFDREESTFTPTCGFDACPPGGPPFFCDETTVLTIAPSSSALHSALTNSESIPAIGIAGFISIDFSTVETHALTSAEGYTFTGLPMIGFVAENFINDNVTPDVLANYSAAIPHRSTLQCTLKSTGAPCE